MRGFKIHAAGLSVLALTLLSTATAVADAPGPIQGSSDVDVVPSPPGANNWSCQPNAAHPRPIVLAHGTFENRLDNWFAMAPRLVAAGYCVYALDFGRGLAGTVSGVGPMRASAQEISDFVDRVLATTGAQQVDIVGHSQGGMLPRYYLKNLGGTPKVHTLVGLAPDNHGTTWGLVGLPITLVPPATDLVCPSCTEQLPTSDFITQLNSGGETQPGVSYTVIASRYDEFATPYTTGFLTGPDVDNITLQDVCPGDFSEHMAMTSDPVAIQLVLNALDPEHKTPVPCGTGVGSAQK
ncbi:alpha/beta fold hydrolase [Nocardia colli]|uniref:Alpha/beta fold hydrolase n=1 Tax=Nocardia colli TaxID=2545717 RepID=A0A5N0E7I4_9NOCA|nr:alpha/beta fold hydrolase [Nocardia colli]KAA8885392.1 alpha/beta fold hydrolase [Nocardia colli]